MGACNSFTRKVRSPPSLSLAVISFDSSLLAHTYVHCLGCGRRIICHSNHNPSKMAQIISCNLLYNWLFVFQLKVRIYVVFWCPLDALEPTRCSTVCAVLCVHSHIRTVHTPVVLHLCNIMVYCTYVHISHHIGTIITLSLYLQKTVMLSLL